MDDRPWTVFRIKSPWIRLPVAWLMAIGFVVPAFIVIILIGAFVGARDAAIFFFLEIWTPSVKKGLTRWRE